MTQGPDNAERTLLLINGIATTILGIITVMFIGWGACVLFLTAFS